MKKKADFSLIRSILITVFLVTFFGIGLGAAFQAGYETGYHTGGNDSYDTITSVMKKQMLADRKHPDSVVTKLTILKPDTFQVILSTKEVYLKRLRNQLANKH